MELIKKHTKDPLYVILALTLTFIPFAFWVDNLENITSGMVRIFLYPDILMVDYMYIGGPGAGIINAVLVGIFCTIVMKASKVKPGGIHVAALWIMIAFAFFGKNILNITPIILGSFIYAKYKKEPFSKYVALSFFATCLAPIVTHMFYIYENMPFVISFILANLAGILIGFFLIPLAMQTAKSHEGFHLYNVGFAAGILSMFLAIILRNFGFYISPVSYWYYGRNEQMLIMCLFVSVVLLIIGFIKHGKISLKECFLDSKIMGDKLTANEGLTYVNMGITGIFVTLFTYFFGELNGPNIGGVLTIIGFVGVGKNMFNIWPVMIGCIATAWLFSWEITSSILAISLYSSTLAPITAKFGPLWGIIAGFLHINMALVIVNIHGGLNLYNNGAAGGFVAIFLLAMIRTFHSHITEKEKQ
jgi:hypothetical protein